MKPREYNGQEKKTIRLSPAVRLAVVEKEVAELRSALDVMRNEVSRNLNEVFANARREAMSWSCRDTDR